MGASAGVRYTDDRAMGYFRHAGRASRGLAGARWLLMVASSCLWACAGERVLGDYPPSSCDLADPPERVADAPLNIATFWAGDSRERDAFQALYGRIDQTRYAPGQATMSSRVDAQRRITVAFDLQRLPDVFQVNGGNDVLRWVEGRDPDSTDVCALDRLRDKYRWGDDYFESALAPLSCRGNLYGLPVGIHHLNVLFYNRRLFEELRQTAQQQGIELVEPAQLSGAAELLEQLRQIAALAPTTAEGEPVVPLAIGAQSEWPLTIVAFENVLLSLGNAAYETLWQGGLIGDDGTRRSELRRTLKRMVELLQDLAGVSNLDQQLTWQDALKHVEAGRALMTVTGDWGWAQLSEQAPESVATVSFPGTQGVFVYTPDSFAVPREVMKDGFPAHYFLHDIVEDKDAVLEFAALKHAIPARNDLSDADLERLPTASLRETYERFRRCDSQQDCKLLLAVSGLGLPPGTDPCFDDIDALLTLAVSGRSPTEQAKAERDCKEPFPPDRAAAAERLVDLLITIGSRRFAPECQ